jgi:hypothetical protein
MMQIGPTTKYYCPYCEKSQWLFSLKPTTSHRWTCTKCGEAFLLDTPAIAHNWLSTITFWSLLPIALALLVFFIAVTKADKLVWAILLGVPVFTFGLVLIVYVLCIPLALIAGRRIREKGGSRKGGLKTVIREIS